ncbi:hypothetical protein BCR35DRAFT_353589 [Leucosporidium creatinivorum]|uniref:Small ribosomal subunit protein bS18m n=1 Tax=Leucosporidium creatinivorum TaxID=106004 RepID=A0A1Y2EVR8_9BASI|nr:hypothetical protein BCR35DRAFT_353589 [Leucosporidium creatinivorum]
MNSLLRNSRTLAALTPSRHAFTSTSTAFFCTSAAAPSLSGRQASAANKLVDLVDDVIKDVGESSMISEDDDGTLLKNLKRDTVIAPQQLSPQYLLTPYLPSPDFSLAHPLGPPVTAARTHDPFVRFDISPLDSPMNPWLRSQYCTSMGKIKSRGNTGLQRSSQRKMGKAVRRARSMGIVATFGVSVPSEK